MQAVLIQNLTSVLIARQLTKSNLRMVNMSSLACSCVFDVSRSLQLALSQHVLSLDSVVCTTEKNINLFQWHILGFWDKEEDEDGKKDVDSREEVKCVESIVAEEGWEELLEDGVGNVLGLRGHSYCLGTDVHGEDF